MTNYAGSEGIDWWSRCPGCAGAETDGGIYKGGIFTTTASTRIADIGDGTSNTIAVSEATANGFTGGASFTSGTGKPILANGYTRTAFVGFTFTQGLSACNAAPLSGNYTQPDGSAVSTWLLTNPFMYQPVNMSNWGPNAEWPGSSSLHTGGVQVLLADGSVRFVSQNINWPTWNNLFSRNSGDLVGDF
jgi:prepilin-type processing-associated H-X9-DG protein